ncbi:MAG: SCP2 sterol-binding domain-containing protein [Anaerolineales bacterium]|nr:SCP2 sterol-binding domain-containing protein [Anaerolineales bacterium]
MDQLEFLNPSPQHRVTPFWGWNDQLREAEVARQIGEIGRGGWGGFFIHARDGLVTPFLGNQWMRCVRAAAEEAGQRRLRTWIYDEHFAPSGFAGGRVPARGPAYRMKALVCRQYNQPMHLAEEVKCFAAETVDGRPARLADITGQADYSGSADSFLNLYEWTEPLGDPEWYYGFCYVDTLAPHVAEAFLDEVYDGHRRALGEAFEQVQGFFMDMASFTMHLSRIPKPSVPWTPDLPQYFQQRNGYDLLARLPALFYDLDDCHAVRVDYWETIAEMFRERFIRRLYRWCDEQGVQFSGHLWGEEMLHWQVQWSGATMAALEHFHVPVVDHILGNIDDPQGLKQGDSVASQLGRPQMGVEAYALSGPGFTFEDRKWIGDWCYVLGANFLIPYIPAYSLRGLRKHDEPPSLFFQQPWWPHNRLVDDYFGRLSYALSQGERVVDILVLQPLASVAALHRAGPGAAGGIRNPFDKFEGTTPEALTLSQAFSDLTAALLNSHRDFHYGDETLLAAHAAVEGGRLRIGRQSYSVIIVPGSLTWRQGTLDLLQAFAAAGGHVLAMEPLPTEIGGRPAGAVLPASARVVPGEPGALLAALDQTLPPEVVLEPPAVWYLHRRTETEDIYFFANTSRTDTYRVEVALRAQGAVEAWDALSGAITPLGSAAEAGFTRVTLTFPPVGSQLLVVRAGAPPHPQPGASRIEGRLPLKPEWSLTRIDPNVLVLDYCELKLDHSAWADPAPVFRHSRQAQAAGVGVPFTARFTFEVVDVPAGPLYLVLEDPERFQMHINGQALPYADAGWWVDPSFRKVDIAGLVAAGRNTITLSARTRPKRRFSVHEAEFEPIYLIGDFQLAPSRALAAEASGTRAGNLAEQGYPFYVGRMRLAQDIQLDTLPKRAFVCLPGLKAVVAEVRANGQTAGRTGWPPYAVEVTGCLQLGKNQVEVEIANSLYNLIGPHHSPHGVARGFVFHMHFDDSLGWTDDYHLEPFGVLGGELIWGDGQHLLDVIAQGDSTMAEIRTAEEYVQAMPASFRAERAQNDQAVIQISLSGEGGGDWYVTIDHGHCQVTSGVSEKPSVTMRMAANDYVAMASGQLSGLQAVMGGKLKTSGNPAVLMKMQSWFANA